MERPGGRQPDRVRLVRPPRPDRRARQVRLLLPRRGAAPARAARPDPRPRRRRPPRHLHGAGRARRRHRPGSASPAPSTPPSTSPTSWPASSPPSTTCPAAGPAGTSSPPRTRSPARTSGAAASCHAEDRYDRARRVPAHRRGSCGTRGAATRSSPTRQSGALPAPTPAPARSRHRDQQFDIAGQFNVPRSPQGHPVILQAGDSDAGREFAAATADAIFSRHSTLEAGQAFYADVKGRLARYGRTPRRAEDPARRRRSCSATPTPRRRRRPTTSAASRSARRPRSCSSSSVWNRDLSAYDPDGPLPDDRPRRRREPRSSRAGPRADVPRPAADRRASGASSAEAKKLSHPRAGHRGHRAADVHRHAGHGRRPASTTSSRHDAADGFILVPHITPGGLDDVRRQGRAAAAGARRRSAPSTRPTTLRDHLGLPAGAAAGRERPEPPRPARARQPGVGRADRRRTTSSRSASATPPATTRTSRCSPRCRRARPRRLGRPRRAGRRPGRRTRSPATSATRPRAGRCCSATGACSSSTPGWSRPRSRRRSCCRPPTCPR